MSRKSKAKKRSASRAQVVTTPQNEKATNSAPSTTTIITNNRLPTSIRYISTEGQQERRSLFHRRRDQESLRLWSNQLVHQQKVLFVLGYFFIIFVMQGFDSTESLQALVANPQETTYFETLNDDDSTEHVKPRRQRSDSFDTVESLEAFEYSHTPHWHELTGQPIYKLGIVIPKRTKADRHLTQVFKPGTSCMVRAVAVLEENEEEHEPGMMQPWFEFHKLAHQKDDISVYWGPNSFERLLQKSSIDAVYIIVPSEQQQQLVLAALKAGKHVMLRDPVSTPLLEFQEQLKCAKKYGKFVQFSTMFVHQYRVRRFMERVLQDDFGYITQIDANLHVNYHNLSRYGVQPPLGPQDGSIRVLGRFCVLVATLFFNRVGSFAKSVQVHSIETSDEGVITKAIGTVLYTEGRLLRFSVGYITSTTRQTINVLSNNRDATMTDFVVEHPSGLASYRVYDKEIMPDGHEQITSGEAIDVSGGPTQDVIMWRTFVGLGVSLDKKGSWDKCPETAEVRELANVALQTKQILIALLKSVELGLVPVEIDGIEYE